MRLIDRYQVEGTDPVIYIGHRAYRASDGKEAVSRPRSAGCARRTPTC